MILIRCFPILPISACLPSLKPLEEGYTIERIEELTKIDKWFLERLDNIVKYKKVLSSYDNIESLAEGCA